MSFSEFKPMNQSSGTPRRTSSIAMTGKFDFSKHRAFRDACESALASGDVGTVHVDLRQVSYLDSSALGMLLLLRDKAKVAGKAVSIATQPGTVRDILRVAHFQDLFALDAAA
jgi:HptB-dependent secretion and biofilm anti anti-sigma factor